MKIIETNKVIKCDTVLCNRFAKFQLITNSYKGDSYLCEKCETELKNLFKRTTNKNEEKK